MMAKDTPPPRSPSDTEEKRYTGEEKSVMLIECDRGRQTLGRVRKAIQSAELRAIDKDDFASVGYMLSVIYWALDFAGRKIVPPDEEYLWPRRFMRFHTDLSRHGITKDLCRAAAAILLRITERRSTTDERAICAQYLLTLEQALNDILRDLQKGE